MTSDRQGLRVEASADGILFWIHVKPGARSESVGPLHGDALRVSVKAPPVDSRANAACTAALARALGVPRRTVDLDPGSRSRRKRVRVRGDPADLETRLRSLASGPRVR